MHPPWALAITPPVLPRLVRRARAGASRCAPLARRRLRRVSSDFEK
jgi:hypothetical protein